MQQVEHGILSTLVVTWRGVDGHTALHFQGRTIVPYLTEITVGHLVDLVQITFITLRLADDEDVGERNNVAVHIDIGRVFHTCHSIDVEGIAVHLRSKLIRGVGPHTVPTLFEHCHTRGIICSIPLYLHFLCWKEVACHLYLHGLGGEEIKGDCSVSIHHGRLYTGTVEQLLLCQSTHAAERCKGDGYHCLLHTILLSF